MLEVHDVRAFGGQNARESRFGARLIEAVPQGLVVQPMQHAPDLEAVAFGLLEVEVRSGSLRSRRTREDGHVMPASLDLARDVVGVDLGAGPCIGREAVHDVEHTQFARVEHARR